MYIKIKDVSTDAMCKYDDYPTIIGSYRCKVCSSYIGLMSQLEKAGFILYINCKKYTCREEKLERILNAELGVEYNTWWYPMCVLISIREAKLKRLLK